MKDTSRRRALARAAWSSVLALCLIACSIPAGARAEDDPPGGKVESAEPDSAAADSAATGSAKEHVRGKSGEKAKAKKAEGATKATTKRNAAKAKEKGEALTEGAKTAPGTMPVKPSVEPQHVQLQHILIGFAGSVPGKGITRTKEEAKKLAYEILERARKGEDFDELVKQYTDDSPPGIYGLSGIGVAPGPGEYPRDRMVPAFGNVGFAISPGNIGIADYDPQASPYGWHVIKRLK